MLDASAGCDLPTHTSARVQVAQLLRIADSPNRLHEALSDVERDDRDRSPIGTEEHRTWVPVDLHEPYAADTQTLALSRPPDEQPRHAVGPVDGPRERHRLAAAIGVGDDVGGEQTNEPL